ncbi:hypothetical protein QOZ80_6AG0527160 [Eleusine coracana subsp. coracana]|nr:hypothetical protein QOZ80_6AG0527160 [Eleusine coracana subsp. coracana]
MCFYTGHLNEKSDVYSFGVILAELLTREKPFLYLSSDGDGLVMHFVNLHAEGNLSQILDPQVKEEGGNEVEEVATLATLCMKMSSDDRPTMRQVEHKLEGLEESIKSNEGNIMEAEELEEKDSILGERQSKEELSRIYSMEQEFMISTTYPR